MSSAMLANQGVIVLLNMFFSPSIVSARAISNQVNNVVNQFVQNFRTAINPQIVKTYAQNDRTHSSFLVLASTKISFYLVLIIGMPLLLNAEFILDLWLVEVPEYTTIFLQLIIIQSFVQTIDNSLYYGLYACGKIKQNAIISPTFALMGFPICYLLFKLGCSPVSMSWCYIGVYSIIGLIIKPILLSKYANYSIKEMFNALKQCFIVFIPNVIVFLLFDNLIRPHMSPFAYFIFSSLMSIIFVFLCVYFWGIEIEIRDKVISIVVEKFKRK